MIYNVSRKDKFSAFDFSILLVTNCLYFAAGMVILHNYHNGSFTGLFTIMLGALNFILTWYFFKVIKGDRNLLYLLIGLTLTFISLAAPIQLQGKSITLFWSAETVLLIWLFKRSQIILFKTASALVTILMIASLMMDWQLAGIKSSLQLPVIYTNLKGLVTNLAVVIALAMAGMQLLKEPPVRPWIAGVSARQSMFFYLITAAIILYLTLFYGINLFFGRNSNIVVANIYHRTLTYLVGLLFLALSRRFGRNREITIILFVVLCSCFLFYAASIGYNVAYRNNYLALRIVNIHFIMNWLSDVIFIVFFYYTIILVKNNAGYIKDLLLLMSWLVCGMLLFFFSWEVNQLYLVLFAHTENTVAYQQQYNKSGLTIIWGICSFAIMWLGMHHHYKTLRIISISVFTATLVKLFTYDISTIGAAGKIGAFISLGVLLLIISFMYQRLKKILIDDEKK